MINYLNLIADILLTIIIIGSIGFGLYLRRKLYLRKIKNK